MELTGDRVEVGVRLLQNGRYTWTITMNVPREQAGGSIGFLRELDYKLRDAFPDHVVRGNGRVSSLEE